MSESILVRVTLDSYDVVHPSQKQTQVYVQIPDVGRASWLLDASFYAALKNEPWPHVVDEAHNDYVQRGVVSDSASAAARKAIVDWLLLSEGADYDSRYDAVQAAWEADQARQHPVARKLLETNESLRVRVAELEKANAGLDDLRVRAIDRVDQLRVRVAELEAERHVTNAALDDAVQALRLRNTQRGDVAQLVEVAGQGGESCVDVGELAEALSLGVDEPAPKCRCAEPDADPYACEAEDCTHEFSELNPFGGGSGPVEGQDAKVSRVCGCGWRTSVWHVDDGSAEEELHGHVTRVHGGVYPDESGGDR